jgi:hypothetical protein
MGKAMAMKFAGQGCNIVVTDQSEYLTGVDINFTGGTLMH